MKIHSKKSVSKPLFLPILITAIILIFVCAYLFTKAFFSLNKSKIEQRLGFYLNHKVSIANIEYLPPTFIVIKSLVLSRDNCVHPPLEIERITLVFSLREIVKKGAVKIDKIYMVRPAVDLFEHPLFFKENIANIVRAINLLAQNRNLKITLEDARIVFERKGNTGKALGFNLRLTVDDELRLASYGEFKTKEFVETPGRINRVNGKDTAPLGYFLRAAVMEDGLEIDNLSLERDNFRAELKGAFKKEKLTLEGFSKVEQFFSAAGSQSKKIDFWEKLGKLIKYGKIPQRIESFQSTLNIDKINCAVIFNPEKLIVENVSCEVNGIPLTLEGGISFSEPAIIELKLSSFSELFGIKGEDKLHRFALAIEGESKKGVFDAVVDFDIDMIADVRQSLRLEIKEASFGFTPDRKIKILICALNADYRNSRSQGSYSFPLGNFAATVNFLNRRIKFIKFNSSIFEGSLNGYAALDTAEIPFRTKFHLDIKEVNAQQFDALLVSLFKIYRDFPAQLAGKIYGKFSSRASYASHPQPLLEGKVAIKEGYFDGIRFFTWLGKFFGIPVLETVKFDEFFAAASLADKSANLRNLNLSSKDIKLKGNYEIRPDGFVSGILSLTLSREILSTSPKFKLLLGILEGKVGELNFDFQVSGPHKNINFKWLESDFKNKLKTLLPDFIVRDIEKKVENAVKSIAAE